MNSSKIAFILIAGVFMLNIVSNFVFFLNQKHINNQSSKLEQRQVELNAEYNLARNNQIVLVKKLAQLDSSYQAQALKIDSLHTENVSLYQRIAISEKRIVDFRKLLEKPTRFQDSTKQTILNNLPK